MALCTRRSFMIAAFGASLAPLALPLASQAAGLGVGPFLLDQGDAPNGLVILDDQIWTLAGMAYNGSDPVELANVLQSVAWQGNITRRFGLAPGASLPDDATTSVEISVHQVSDSNGASQLLAYFVADRAAAESLQAVSVANLADETAALTGTVAQGQEATVYVRFESGGDSFVVRVTGYSPKGNPLGDVLNLCQTIVGKA